jgi:formate dehydrogenase maturation protein FdhE
MDDENRASFPCPVCGNDDIDGLVWDDPETGSDFVTCLICETRYNPLTNDIQRPS